MKNSKLYGLLFCLVISASFFSGSLIADSSIPGCIAYWNFDESSGDIAYDSSGNGNDATLINGPVRTESGTISLDGIDDYVSTPFIINPADGPFSVFAWVKGGNLTGAIISQADPIQANGVGRAWLYVSANGTLSTALHAVYAETLIPDTQWDTEFWHHVGFVWDGQKRHIYLDGIVIAGDSNSIGSLESSNGSMFIGAYKNLGADYFWDGEVDNVSIYNRSLTPAEIRNMSILPGTMGLSGTYAPDGTELKPYLIQNITDFEIFATNSIFWADGVHTRLDCDIDLSSYEFDNSIIAPNYFSYASIDSIRFPEPVGEYYASYDGNFEGNGHVISNINIINRREYLGDIPINQPYIPPIGLFSTIGEDGFVKNLFIKDSEITSYSGSIGILAGYNSGQIENCHVLDSTLVNYDSSTGGLVGESDGVIYRCSAENILIFSYLSVDRWLLTDYRGAGGLVGVAYRHAQGMIDISYSFSTGIIYGTSNIGGFIGNNYSGGISNCYTLSDVTGYSSIGGFVGYNNGGDIDKCYSASRVITSETSNYNNTWCAFFGGWGNGARSNCFWDKELAGNIGYSNTEYNYLPTGLTTSEMYDSFYFRDASWSFGPLADDDYWIEQVDGYPILSWEVSMGYSHIPVISVSRDDIVSTDIALNAKNDCSWQITGYQDCPWILSVTPNSGMIGSADPVNVTITVDSTGLNLGHYNCKLILSNSFGAEIVVPVIMIVQDKMELDDFAKLADLWMLDNTSIDKSYRNVDWSWDDQVDISDLAILTDNWLAGYKYISPYLLLNWQFSTEQDYLALDSSGNNFNGILRNEPLWNSNGSMAFDGDNDYIEAPFVLNPADGPFSAFAWVQGGDPGTLIISQADGSGSGSSWLHISGDRKLGSILNVPDNTILYSNISWDFSLWHHVGVVWDGQERHMYIDGVEVAVDTENIGNLTSCDGNLYIGAYKYLESNYFWSGQIDDVRVYKHPLSVEEIQAVINMRTEKASLFTHYKFDSIDNSIVLDSVGSNNGIAYGDTAVTPGTIDGNAASFDGDGDYIEIPSLQDSSIIEPFAIFTWVKGGGPKQVLVSQKDGTNYDFDTLTDVGRAWLYISADGLIGSSLEGAGSTYLSSEIAWNGDNWHHIGLVWDGSRRSIYLDGAVIAQDAEGFGPLNACDGSILIGAYKTLADDNFWNGHIDDVRVYIETLSAPEIAELATIK